MDLGTKAKDSGPGQSASPEIPKTSYPSFSLNDDIAKSFLAENPATLGDTITATVTMKVTSLTQDQYGSRVGFDVTNIDNVSSGAGDEDEDEIPGALPGDKPATPKAEDALNEETPEDAAEQKVLGYKRPKKAAPAKEVPPFAAKDLA